MCLLQTLSINKRAVASKMSGTHPIGRFFGRSLIFEDTESLYISPLILDLRWSRYVKHRVVASTCTKTSTFRTFWTVTNSDKIWKQRQDMKRKNILLNKSLNSHSWNWTSQKSDKKHLNYEFSIRFFFVGSVDRYDRFRLPHNSPKMGSLNAVNAIMNISLD